MNNRLRSVILTLFVAFVLAAVAMPASAQDQDPPGVAGRLSFMQGPVSLQPGGVDDWIDGVLNRPLTSSDRVWTDSNARAEVAMGNIKARMDQQTSMTITDLEDNITQLELDQGSLFVHVRRLFDGESVEIDSPNVAFVIDQPGDYRFDVDPNADTTYVSVYKGQGEGTGEAAGITVADGQQVVFSGGNSGNYQMADLGDPDDFSNWNMDRDRRRDHSRSEAYVSPGVVGYDDLDDNGDWADSPEYGHIWRPRVEVGWAPYHSGHWAWIDPWGYTWVDDASWGYAPFHYGRWVYYQGGWGWAPGPVVAYGSPGWVRPVYAPALVAFVGGGGFGVGISVGGGGGAVGWVPLGWGEPYYPSYHVSEAYVRNVNVTNTRIVNITNVTNNYTVINRSNTTVINEQNVHYANASVAGGVTAVPANAMASGRSVSSVAVRVDARQMQSARFSASPGVAPTKEAVLGGRAPATQHVPPASISQRPVMAQHAPPPAPAKFEAKQQLLANNNGRPLDRSQVQSLPKVNRPAPMAAGKPRPAAAVAALNAAKPKGGPAAAPAFHPPAAKPNTARPAGPANANRPGAPANAGRPGAPANEARPGTPANENRPAEATRPGTPATGRPIPSNTPAPRPNTPPARENNNAERPSNATRPGEPAPTPGAGRTNQPSDTARPVPHPPSRDNTPARTESNPSRPEAAPSRPGNEPSRTESTPSRPAPPPSRTESTPTRPTPPPARTESAPSRPAAPPARTETAPSRPAAPPARENNASRPPARESAPPKESKPAKDNKSSNTKEDKKSDKKPE